MRILFLEDSEEDVVLVQQELRRGGITFTSVTVDTRADFEKGLSEFNPDIIISDHSMPQFDSLEALEIAHSFQEKSKRKIPFILVTGTVSEEYASSCIQKGANDYFLKDNLRRLPMAVRGALEKCRIENERQAYLDKILEDEARATQAERLALFGSWTRDSGSGETKWSHEMFRILGYEPGEVHPQYETMINHIHHEDVLVVKIEIGKTLTTLVPCEFEFRIITKSGKEKTLHSRIAAEVKPEPRSVKLVGFCLDITKRKMTENLLQEAYALARIGGWDLDVARKKLMWSDVTRQLFEVTPDFVPDLERAISFSREGINREIISTAINSSLQKGTSWDVECEITTAKGNQRWLRVIGKADMREGKCVRLYGTYQDIDERKRAQISLESQNVALRRIAWTHSHEIRAPLARIMGLIQLINLDNNTGLSEDDIIKPLTESAYDLDNIIRKTVRLAESFDHLVDEQ